MTASLTASVHSFAKILFNRIHNSSLFLHKIALAFYHMATSRLHSGVLACTVISQQECLRFDAWWAGRAFLSGVLHVLSMFVSVFHLPPKVQTHAGLVNCSL